MLFFFLIHCNLAANMYVRVHREKNDGEAVLPNPVRVLLNGVSTGVSPKNKPSVRTHREPLIGWELT